MSNATEGRDTRSSSSPSGTRTFPWGVHGLSLRKQLQRVDGSRTPHERARGSAGSVLGRRQQSRGGPGERRESLLWNPNGRERRRRAGLLPPGGDRHPPAQGISIER